MLQSLAGKLNRLNDVREIGEAIADELRLADRLPQLPRRPASTATSSSRSRSAASCVAQTASAVDCSRTQVGEGITGRVAETRRAAARRRTRSSASSRCTIPGTPTIEESLARRAAPLRRARDRRDRRSRSSASTSSTRTTSGCSRCSPATPRSRSRTRASTSRSAARPRARRRCSSSRRELATAATPRRRSASEIVRAAARILGGTPRTSLWLADEDGDLLDQRAASDYDGEPALRRARRALPVDALASAIGDAAEPFVVDRRRVRAGRSRGALDPTRLRDRAARRRRRARGLHRRERSPTSEHPASESLRLLGGHRAPGAARARERARSYESLERDASSRPSRRSRTRSRRTTSTRRRTRAGSPTSRCASATSSASTSAS